MRKYRRRCLTSKVKHSHNLFRLVAPRSVVCSLYSCSCRHQTLMFKSFGPRLIPTLPKLITALASFLWTSENKGSLCSPCGSGLLGLILAEWRAYCSTARRAYPQAGLSIILICSSILIQDLTAAFKKTPATAASVITSHRKMEGVFDRYTYTRQCYSYCNAEPDDYIDSNNNRSTTPFTPSGHINTPGMVRRQQG